MPNYFSDEVLFTSPSGDLVVKQTAKGVYNVVHVGTNLIAPTRTLRRLEDGSVTADIGTYRGKPIKGKNGPITLLSEGWRTKLQAKKYMLAIEATGLLHDYPEEREERQERLRKLQDWMETL